MELEDTNWAVMVLAPVDTNWAFELLSPEDSHQETLGCSLSNL